MKEELLRLAERCEKATGPDRELDKDIAAAVHMKQLTYQSPEWIKDPEFTASLDAAMTLVPEGWALAGMQTAVFNRGKASAAVAAVECDVPTKWARSDAATPALALCAAALRASVKEQNNGG